MMATRWIFALLMSLFMSVVMTFTISLLNTGWDAQFLARWGRAISLAWPLAFILVLTVAPPMQRLATKLAAKGGKLKTCSPA